MPARFQDTLEIYKKPSKTSKKSAKTKKKQLSKTRKVENIYKPVKIPKKASTKCIIFSP
jgi:hypothetical protein